jgi:hypothetical protein
MPFPRRVKYEMSYLPYLGPAKPYAAIPQPPVPSSIDAADRKLGYFEIGHHASRSKRPLAFSGRRRSALAAGAADDACRFLPVHQQFATQNNAGTTRTCGCHSSAAFERADFGWCRIAIILRIVIHGVTRRMGEPAGAHRFRQLGENQGTGRSVEDSRPRSACLGTAAREQPQHQFCGGCGVDENARGLPPS